MRENEGRFPRRHKSSISLSDGDVLINNVIVMSKIDSCFVTRQIKDLRKIFGWSDLELAFEVRLEKIAHLLNAGRQFEAIFIANLSPWGDDSLIRKANFNRDEPRDEKGWWSIYASESEGKAAVEDAQYRGFFHDVVVDDLLKGLAARGGTVLKNVRILGLNGILAIPDGASKPSGWAKPYFIEVKTGTDPDFTPNQKQVYPLICLGGQRARSILGSLNWA